VHSGDAPSDDYPERAPRFSGAEEATRGGHGKHAPTPPPAPGGAKERVPPFAPSGGKLGGTHQELADPTGASSLTQKRRLSADSLEEATPGGEESAARKVREEDREYYRTHKPSPLAEVELADTRKPEAHHARHGRQCHGPVRGRGGPGGGGHGGRLAGARRGHVPGGRVAREP